MAVKRKRDPTVSNPSRGVRKTKGEVDDPKVHPLGTTLADLPCDIISKILLKLPIKSVLICKCMCKSWHSIISDPYFAQMYSEHAPTVALVRTSDPGRVSRTLHLLDFDEFNSNEAHNLPSDNGCGHVCSCEDSRRPDCYNHTKLEAKFKLPLRDSKMVLDTMLEARRRGEKRTNNIACKPKDDKFDVVNSCNGLLCLWDPVKSDQLVVCNPITGEFIRLPRSENDRLLSYRSVYSGFGYLEKTNEYKVIRTYVRDVALDDSFVEIHTLGTKLWRNIKYHDGPFWANFKSPTCLNGSLHWLVYDSRKASILCFDLESETSKSFPCPKEVSSAPTSSKSILSFGELKGRLYLCLSSGIRVELGFWFWTMKRCGDGESWALGFFFRIGGLCHEPPLFCQPIVNFGGPGIFIDVPPRFFIYHDPQKKTFRLLEGRGTSVDLQSIFHIASLVRLKDAVKGDDIEVLNVHSRCAAFKLREDKEVLHLAKPKDDTWMSNHIERCACLMEYR